jgi:hypothetical protein
MFAECAGQKRSTTARGGKKQESGSSLKDDLKGRQRMLQLEIAKRLRQFPRTQPLACAFASFHHAFGGHWSFGGVGMNVRDVKNEDQDR